jgi:phosphinothricin acetyltransferase
MDGETVMIRAATPADAGAITAIYNHYVANTTVTFEEKPISSEEMARRIDDVQAVSLPWLVAQRESQVVGFAYAAPWKVRSAYRFSVEITIYLATTNTRCGLGSMLYRGLFSILRARGVHAVIGGIALPNPASVALHEKFGLEKVAHFHQVGYKFDQWVDVGYWQILLGAP